MFDRFGFNRALACVLIAGSAMCLGFNSQAHAQEDAETASPTPGRVYGDFAKLTLTDAQKADISKIQKEAKDQISKIEADAENKARALLNDEQKKQLADIDADRKEREKKAYEAKKVKDKADREELDRIRKEKQDREAAAKSTAP
jgi:Spy/CpxP family protein refolding chaperone